MKKVMLFLIFVCIGTWAMAGEKNISEGNKKGIMKEFNSKILPCSFTVNTTCGDCWNVWLLDCTWGNIGAITGQLELLCPQGGESQTQC